jgi:hypothetical protein
MQTTTHDCGGTILDGSDHRYCDNCRAFSYRVRFPSGIDIEANRKAWDNGEEMSPARNPWAGMTGPESDYQGDTERRYHGD